MRILLTSGHTGGHIFPVLAVAKKLKQITACDLRFAGKIMFGQSDFAKLNIKTKTIYSFKWRPYFSLKNLLDLLKIPLAILQAFWQVFSFMPDAVFAKGCAISLPVIFWAYVLRVPIIIHESDAVPGRANRLAGKLAKKIIISFASARSYFNNHKTILVGNPIRSEIMQGEIKQAINKFKLNPNLPLVLITGGSQGAEKINELAIKAVPDLIDSVQIFHITGPKNFSLMQAEIRSLALNNQEHYLIKPFVEIKDFKNLLTAADLVIARAGAGSLFEIAALGKPSIIIPLPSAASDHQRANAYQYAEYGGASVLEQANLTANMLKNEILELLQNSELLRKMSVSAKNFAKPEAARQIAEQIVKAANQSSVSD